MFLILARAPEIEDAPGAPALAVSDGISYCSLSSFGPPQPWHAM